MWLTTLGFVLVFLLYCGVLGLHAGQVVNEWL